MGAQPHGVCRADIFANSLKLLNVSQSSCRFGMIKNCSRLPRHLFISLLKISTSHWIAISKLPRWFILACKIMIFVLYLQESLYLLALTARFKHGMKRKPSTHISSMRPRTKAQMWHLQALGNLTGSSIHIADFTTHWLVIFQ